MLGMLARVRVWHVNVVRASHSGGARFASTTVPVTVLSGFLGAGKTTLVNRILAEKQHEKRIAVLVNDMADINIDANLISKAGGDAVESMVQLENGCICCTLRDDLVMEVATLAKKGDLDHIVVESTGISEPHPVAQAFSIPITELMATNSTTPGDLEEGNAKAAALAAATAGLNSLQDAAHLHSLVTVVDCMTFLERLSSIVNLQELGMASTPGDARPLAYLLMEQVQFANFLLLNKTDLVTPAERQKVQKLLCLLNPSATVFATQHSAIDVPALLSRQQYDEDHFSSMPAWVEELAANRDNADDEGRPRSEAEEYGIQHFTLQVVGRPFHAQRWFDALQGKDSPKLFAGVLRAKGCFWTSEEPDTRIDYSHVGRISDLIVNQLWAQVGLDVLSNWATPMARPAEEAVSLKRGIERFSKEAERMRLTNLWHPRTHDRRIELVFIGDHRMQKGAIQDAVESAMLTHDETRSFLDSWEQIKMNPSQTSAGANSDSVPSSNPFSGVPRCVRI